MVEEELDLGLVMRDKNSGNDIPVRDRNDGDVGGCVEHQQC